MKSTYQRLIALAALCTINASANATQICGKGTYSCRDEHTGSYKCCHDSNKHHQYYKQKHKKSSSENTSSR